MSNSVPAIRSVRARGVVVPLARPVKTAFGVIDAGPLVLIDVETDQGVTGHSYILAYTRMMLKPLIHLVEETGRELIGKPIAPYDLMAAMNAKFRLLDRLDDGWKPFWLDTLAIEPGQTQRIAFQAEYPGRYLIESVATDWAAPRLVRWYAVE